jgi:hypothetical protein
MTRQVTNSKKHVRDLSIALTPPLLTGEKVLIRF